MNLKPLTAFNDNYIWMLEDPYSKKCWVVDPGDAHPVLVELSSRKISLSGILLTHHHHDHSGGIPALRKHFPDIPVFASKHSPHTFVSHPVEEHNAIEVGDVTLRVLEIPGHTLDHVAFYNQNMLFCGDTLFSAGCGKVFEGTPEIMCSSLQKLKRLRESTQVFCGHEYTLKNLAFAEIVEPDNQFIKEKIKVVTQIREQNIASLPSTLADELKINPFLRCEVQSVVAAAENHAGRKLHHTVEVFSVLRDWKNHF